MDILSNGTGFSYNSNMTISNLDLANRDLSLKGMKLWQRIIFLLKF